MCLVKRYILKNCCSILFLLIFGAFQSFGQLNAEQLLKEVNKIIYYDASINYDEVPGFIVGIVTEDSTFIFDFGAENKGGQTSLNKKHFFELGGITKVFMSSLVQVLASEGHLSLDDDINQYLKKNQQNPNINLKISDILTHTSGFPRLPHGIGRKEKEANNPYAHYTREDLLEFYTSYRTFDVEKQYQYSHVTYALLEIAIENIFQKSLEKVFQEKLLIPLGLEDTKLDLQPKDKIRLAKGYNILGKESKPWSFASFKGSVGLKSTMQDLIKFVQANLGLEEHPLVPTLKNCHESSQHTALDKDTYIASGWHVLKKKHCNVVAHSGSTAGHRSFIGFVDKTKTGVIVLSNSENGLNSLGFHILRMLNNNWKKVKKKSS